MTDKKTPEGLPDDALDNIRGGFLNLGVIDGEPVKTSYNTVTGIGVADKISRSSLGDKGSVLIQQIGFPDDGGGSK